LCRSADGKFQLYVERWKSDRHDHVRAAVYIHPGELDHTGWYNGLAVRLTNVGGSVAAMDAQGFGQSDGARGYFEHFEEAVDDFTEFCKSEWSQLLSEQSRAPRTPGFVLIGKGFGALVVMKALPELSNFLSAWEISPVIVLLSPAFQFTSSVTDQQALRCGLPAPGGHCGRSSSAPVEPPALGKAVEEEKALDHLSWWLPKMIVTPVVEPDTVSRDPAVADRMVRDNLCWHQGYRARILYEMLREQASLADFIVENMELFSTVPALLLHGSSDRLFAVQGCHRIHSAWCDAAQSGGMYPRMKIYDGAYHMLLNEPNKEEVLRDIVLFAVNKAMS